MKKLFILMIILALAVSCAAAENIRVAALKGPTAMGMAEMIDSHQADYAFEICASADEITPRLVKGEIDIAALPANLASVLYNRTGGEIRVLAINTLGVMYIAERGNTISSVSDLRGKTIYTAGKGSTPEYALNYILEANGLVPGRDVNIEFKSEHSECLAALLNDAGAAAMLPQPFITTALAKAQDMRVALDLTQEWEKLGNGTMITGVAVARRELIEQQGDVVAAFLRDYADSVDYVLSNNTEAAVLVEKAGIVPAAVAEKALPACNIRLITGQEMQKALSAYLEILFEAAPESVGGALPDASFYYGAEE